MNETHAGPTHANPQSEHSLTRDTQWVGGKRTPNTKHQGLRRVLALLEQRN